MRTSSLVAFAALAIGAQAQQDFGTQVVTALRAAGLTTLADVVGNNTQLASALQGSNKTVLAPTNEAFVAAGTLPTGAELLNLISYHVLNGTYRRDNFDDNDGRPVRTLLTQGVRLPGGQSQVVFLDEIEDRSTVISGNNSRSTLASQTDGSALANVLVQPISQVLRLPGSFAQLLEQTAGASSLRAALQSANLAGALDNFTGTIFVPNNAAFMNSAQTIAAANETLVRNVLTNHLVNGTVVYASQLTEDGNSRVREATSAAGLPLRFEENDDNLFVISGDVRARIVQSNLLTSGGVVHVIDAVLVNTAPANPSAAAAAASSAATQTPTNTGSGSTPSRTGSPDGALSVKSLSAASVGMFAIAVSALILA